MKKFIPFLSIMIAAVFMQNCSHRDEDMIPSNKLIKNSERSADVFSMKQDSAKSTDLIENPNPKDPPVRDGDNWRLTKD
ncbi:hypothetical protein [Chryseobacterium sp. YIM B08800]|uniref:hypothetical protein n=1 Tax=Chryseobacterium sp. YIM B08800 TaxID=2984136 RepID=UPI00223EA324|nr:hypothetical protein [Chryseobacterium sp. YIM B08800]